MSTPELEKIHAEIAHLMAQTAKASKEACWYEVTITVAATLAAVTVAKLFM